MPDLCQDINGGRVVMDVRALGLEVGRKTYNICKDLQVTCPIKAGVENTAVLRYPVPWWAVSSTATVGLVATGEPSPWGTQLPDT